MFAPQSSKPNLWEIQQSISEFWKDNHIFEQSVEQRPVDNPYRFYDGPPFVTGLPHYGHLASSVAKDVIPRYQTMRGKRVERVWGRDCHGIPIEQKVQDKLGLTSNAQIEEVGVERFIQECYNFTNNTSEEWEWYVDNFGRRVDFNGSYKTMDNDYMESVWWVFKQIWDKGLIYKGKRVSLYSTKLETPISNFEVAMDDSYEEINDPAITVKFRLTDTQELGALLDGREESVYFLAWTTTPWTIPAHIALGVHKDLEYALVEMGEELYIVAQARVEDIFKGKDHNVLRTFPGVNLVGLDYEPPFGYYTQREEKKHVVVHAEFATDESGTGIVHQAPEFGEEDFNLGKEEGLLITEAMDSSGHYTDEIDDLEGVFYRDANDQIIERLRESGHLFAKASITHRVAFCPRTHIPLVYKAQDSRFIDIQSIKDKLLAANEEINRYPAHFKYGRFAKSIESAPDRCISRTRYRGTPMPVYAPEDQVRDQNVQSDDVVVVGSREELYQKQKNGSDNLTKFYLVRHGEATKNVEGWQDCRGVSPLTETGKEQAQGVADQLQDVTDAAVYISPMPRTFQTILPYLTGVLGLDEGILQQKFDEQLELFHTLFDEGKIINYIVNEEGPVQFELSEGVYIDWRITEALITNNHGPDAPQISCGEFNRYDWEKQISSDGGSETMMQLRKRFQSFVDEVSESEVIVVSHADPLVVLQSVLKNQGEGGYKSFRKKYYPTKATVQSLYYLRSRQVELDMHIPYLDDVWFEINDTKYIRLPDVLDSWMESGSMPYGQMHYPFENKEKMEASFPADYIVEYTGQIRARFYVMHVLGVILFEKPAYTNVICHGVVSGDDGRKMSKSLGNFPDPKPTFRQYGGDAIRMSILASPLFNAGDTSISEENIAEALRTYVLPLWNAFSFFTTYANIDQRESSDDTKESDNVLDQWILGELSSLTSSVTQDLDGYDLQHSSRALGGFLDNLTNRYIRRSRRRFWKTESSDDKHMAYQTLYDVLLGFCQVAAPFMPFVTEYIWKELQMGDADSIHLTTWPQAGAVDEALDHNMALAQQIVKMGLAWRSQHDIRVRQPLATLTVGVELSDYYQAILRDELNIKSVISDTSLNDEVTQIVKPDGKKIGPKFGKDVKNIFSEAKSGNFVHQDDGSVLVADQRVLESDEYEISYIKKDPTKDVVVDQGIVMSIDSTITPELELEGYVRDLVRAIQDARKEADYDIADRIKLSLSGSKAEQMKDQFGEYIEQETLSTLVDDLDAVDIEKELELGSESVYFKLRR